MAVLQTERDKTHAQRLAGKVAVVTGGARGIGRGIALKLAQEGAIVAFTYAKSKEAADQLVKEIEQLGTTGLAFQADAKSKKDNEQLVEALKKQFGKIDILVNNAGVWEGAPAEQVTLEQYDRIFDVNVKGLLATMIAALPLIPEGGRIINISSGVAVVTLPGMSVYSASKAAVNALTRVWAQDLGKRGITVNSVSPGTTESDMMNQALNDQAKEYAASKTALGRIGTPNDIARVVAFLASEDGGWVTGQDIRADGGLNF